MTRYLSIIGQRLIEFVKYSHNFFKKMISYLLSITLEAATFSNILTLLGTIILVWGVLSRNSIEVINNSILANDQPGIITAILFPDNILSFMIERNRVVLGVLMICFGVLFDLSLEKTQKYIFLKLFLVSLLIFYLLCAAIAGFNRSDIINKWKDKNCKYQWLITRLFTKEYFYNTLSKFEKANQGQEFIIKTLQDMEFVRDAFGIDVKFKGENKNSPSIREIEIFQDETRKEVENTRIFYYLFKPKKLLNAFW